MRRLGIPALFVGLGVAVAVAVVPAPGESATAPAGPVVLTASPDESLIDGQVVTVFADADVSSELHAIRVHLCRHDANITDAAAFGPGGANCPSEAIGGGQAEAAISLPAGSLVAQLQYTVGTGTAKWVSDQGRKQTLTCDVASPCDLVVQLDVPDATVYAALPLQFGAPTTDPEAGDPAAPAPDAAAPVAAAAADPVATSAPVASTVELAPSPTTTTAPTARRARGSAVVAQASPTATITADDVSRGMRVFAGGVAGLIGGVLIVLIVARARRRIRELDHPTPRRTSVENSGSGRVP